MNIEETLSELELNGTEVLISNGMIYFKGFVQYVTWDEESYFLIVPENISVKQNPPKQFIEFNSDQVSEISFNQSEKINQIILKSV